MKFEFDLKSKESYEVKRRLCQNDQWKKKEVVWSTGYTAA